VTEYIDRYNDCYAIGEVSYKFYEYLPKTIDWNLTFLYIIQKISVPTLQET